MVVPLANGTQRHLPLWLGPMDPAQRQRWEASGHVVHTVSALQPWGGLAELFREQERGRRLVVQLADGDPQGVQRQWWQRVYPQLCWDSTASSLR